MKTREWPTRVLGRLTSAGAENCAAPNDKPAHHWSIAHNTACAAYAIANILTLTMYAIAGTVWGVIIAWTAQGILGAVT